MVEYNAPNTTWESRSQQVLEWANSRFQEGLDWISFRQELLGPEGIVQKMFPTDLELDRFKRSAEYERIEKMFAKLRRRRGKGDDKENTRVITVRLPQSVHQALAAQAKEHKTSINKLCITKLLEELDLRSEADDSAETHSGEPAFEGPTSAGRAPKFDGSSDDQRLDQRLDREPSYKLGEFRPYRGPDSQG